MNLGCFSWLLIGNSRMRWTCTQSSPSREVDLQFLSLSLLASASSSTLAILNSELRGGRRQKQLLDLALWKITTIEMPDLHLCHRRSLRHCHRFNIVMQFSLLLEQTALDWDGIIHLLERRRQHSRANRNRPCDRRQLIQDLLAWSHPRSTLESIVRSIARSIIRSIIRSIVWSIVRSIVRPMVRLNIGSILGSTVGPIIETIFWINRWINHWIMTNRWTNHRPIQTKKQSRHLRSWPRTYYCLYMASSFVMVSGRVVVVVLFRFVIVIIIHYHYHYQRIISIALIRKIPPYNSSCDSR